ncbi:hypothetical protein IQ06DRAFT_244147 [Phaeosphaeriaceae sp. SRC1lsM3a]|nr:hypothetical protein IQ06DRAFT_244147 [Stagonospora sp. SRC1lsM3a]
MDSVSTLIKERLSVSKDAAMLLRSMHDLQKAPSCAETTVDKYQWMRSLKQELPLLKTDIELDLASFGKSALPALKDLKIPSEFLDEENDEGLDWPSKYQAYPGQCAKQVKAEKLAVSRDVLLYLQDALTDHFSAKDSQKLVEQSLQRKTVKKIIGADSLQRSSSDDSMLLDCIHAPGLSSPFNARTSTVLKRRAEDLKVEGPLTPPLFSSSPMKKLKSVTFTEGLHQIIPEARWANAMSVDDDESEPDFDELFKDFEPYATEARRKVETERLVGADTMARVNPPVLDFTLPVAPWNEYSRTTSEFHRLGGTELDAQMKFLRRLKREDLKDMTSWYGMSSLERSLKWNIFLNKVSKIEVDEKLHGETEVTKMLADATHVEVASSSSQIWKPEGLRILDPDDEEEEIEVAEVEEHRDVEAIVRKRRLMLEEESQPVLSKRIMLQTRMHTTHLSRQEDQGQHEHFSRVQPVSNHSATVRSHPEPHSRTIASQPTPPQVSSDGRNDLMFGGFSATTALHKFMETRGKVIETLVQSPANAGRSARNAHGQILPESSIPMFHLYEDAELIYRDYNRPHSTVDEADILLSPSTGLILTTLQQTKQRPLPGQPDRSPLKERMSKLQKRYERLIVMISEALSPEMEEQGSSRPDDARDKESLTLLKDFAGTLEGEVLVKYVPGGEKALARRIVGEMAAYGLPHGSQDIGDIKPVAVETTWEVFLRQIGINPFAAQVIVASLKDPFDIQLPGATNSGNAQTMSVTGLSAFLLMGEEMRVRYFQTLMGGSRILKRVSRVLDQEWVSAAHGFRLR